MYTHLIALWSTFYYHYLTLQMSVWRLRNIKQFSLGYAARKWLSPDLNSGSLAEEPIALPSDPKSEVWHTHPMVVWLQNF